MDDPNCEAANPDLKQKLCLSTGGKWLDDTCGDWVCGEMPDCDAVIPGCNCGLTMNYTEGKGCLPDPQCKAGPGPVDPNDPQKLCGESGGEWVEDACGQYKCGTPPAAMCLNPPGGCDCGEGKVLVKELGCAESLICEGATIEELCTGTGGEWILDSCGNWPCGNEPMCNFEKPGCNCGATAMFAPNYGCFDSVMCDK